jgi:hypothetical protein
VKITFQGGAAATLSVSGFLACLLVKSVARIPCSTVLGPWAHTHPTEFVLALLACHMAVQREKAFNEAERKKKRTTTYLQPPFFSIVLWHCGHSFVLLLIQFAVSLSSRHFFNHIFATAHIIGLWSLSIGQPKQNQCSFPTNPNFC